MIMYIFRKIIFNQFSISIVKFFKNIYLEIKYRNKNIRIASTSYIKDTIFWKNNSFWNNCNIIWSKIGDYTYMSSDCNVFYTEFWRFCSIWPNLKCWLWKHPTNFVSTHPIFFSTLNQVLFSFVKNNSFEEWEKITIWNDVRIWANVIIRDWVKIWDWAIIGAWSVVVKDIEPYVIVWWIPAKLIKLRFTEEQIHFLLQKKRREKDINWIRKNYKEFYNIDTFIHLFK